MKKLWFENCAWRLKRLSIDRRDNDGHYEYNNCEFIELRENIGKNRRKSILQFDLDGNFIREWESIAHAIKYFKFNYH